MDKIDEDDDGTEEQRRCFCDVRDVVSALIGLVHPPEDYVLRYVPVDLDAKLMEPGHDPRDIGGLVVVDYQQANTFESVE